MWYNLLGDDELDTERKSVRASLMAGRWGFATSEPYIYEHEIDEWGKPLAFQLLHDTGWVYSEGLARYSHEQMAELGIVGNGSDDTLGNFSVRASARQPEASVSLEPGFRAMAISPFVRRSGPSGLLTPAAARRAGGGRGTRG